ncbi:MAG: hypothetical protein SOT46_01340 [Treponema sp.]|nr:hypothetical protein [Spirochaetia bacterium]MDY2838998.1 hypothetical protein [Treponema sp.]
MRDSKPRKYYEKAFIMQKPCFICSHSSKNFITPGLLKQLAVYKIKRTFKSNAEMPSFDLI